MTDDINITSINQSGGITAHTVNYGTKLPELTDDKKEEIMNYLPDNKEAVIHISAINADNRSVYLGNQIFSFLKEFYPNLRGVHTVIVPIIEGVKIEQTSTDEYVVLIGVV